MSCLLFSKTDALKVVIILSAIVLSTCDSFAAKRSKKSMSVQKAVASAPDFSQWKIFNYKKRLNIKTGIDKDAEYYIAIHGATSKCDTLWSAVSPPLAIGDDAHEFVMSVEIKCDWAIRDHNLSGKKIENAFFWINDEGRTICTQRMPHMATGGSIGYERIREWGRIPKGAKSCKVKLGFSSPNLKGDDVAVYRAFRFETVPVGQSRADEFNEAWRDNRWAREVFALRDSAPLQVVSEHKRAEGGPTVSLRDDGFTMVDGEPFFPIGVYNVKRADVNSNSLDRAFADLKAAGFNMAHTYVDAYDPEFLDAARKHDMKLWVSAHSINERFLQYGLNNPNILAWYVGDDTSNGTKPSVLRERCAMLKAVDPRRITCQADAVKANEAMSCYAAYLTYTDVFLPEIYPVYGRKGDPSDSTCVARAIFDMKRIAADVRQFNDGRPRGCWPIIQYFCGWHKWFHFPSREQVFAMTWASVVHGAHGVLYFIYNGTRVNKKTGIKNQGITETPETWRNISDLATQLKEWSPIILARTPDRQPTVEIVEGPKRDPLDVDTSVTCLYKIHNGKGRLIAVNACPEPVTARFNMPDGESFTRKFSAFEVLLK